MHSKKNILIVGGAGRDHALGWKLKQSPHVGTIYFAPGNSGTAKIGINIPIESDNIKALVAFAKNKANDIYMTVIGPYESLMIGVVDAFETAGLRIFGPTKRAAMVETLKTYSKKMMMKCGIKTAAYKVFNDHTKALAYVRKFPSEYVIKASGPALGRGVFACKTTAEAEKAIRQLMVKGIFGKAGNTIVIEELLTGFELSMHVISDGKHFLTFPFALDHKKALAGDKGPNTGGMGTITPVRTLSPALHNEICRKVVEPLLEALARNKNPFRGCLFPGLMVTKKGVYVLEYNARFGDPEAQVFMRLLKSDLFPILEASIDGTIHKVKTEWRKDTAACVILVSGGYPNHYKKGFPITGIERAEELPGIVVFSAGTGVKLRPVTAGGRVLGVSAYAKTLKEALREVYEAISCISFKGMQFRKDIGKKTLKLEHGTFNSRHKELARAIIKAM